MLARQEIHKRVVRLILTPVETPTHVAFQVTGDLRLFAPGDVELGTSSSQSAEHYKIALPICHLITGTRKQTKSNPGYDIRVDDGSFSDSDVEKENWREGASSMCALPGPVSDAGDNQPSRAG